MCTGVELGLIFAGVGAATGAASAIQSHEAGRSAANKAKDAALAAEQAQNKLNGKRPDLGALDSANAMSERAGPSGTLLTGPGGVDPNKLLLGRSTLLGG